MRFRSRGIQFKLSSGYIMDDFQTILASIHGALGTWRCDPTTAEWNAFFAAAQEAMEVEDGPVVIENANVSFRELPDLTVSLTLGGFDEPDDQFWFSYGFLFSLAGRLQVVVGVEEDRLAGHVVYRGDRAAFEEVALQLKMFKGNVFNHLHDGMECGRSP